MRAECGGGAEVFEPEGEVEILRGEVAGGDEVEHGVLKLGGELGEGIAGTGAGEGVECIQAEGVGFGSGRARGGAAAGEGCVQARCEMSWIFFGLGDEAPQQGVQGGELGRAESLWDVDCAFVNEALQMGVPCWLGHMV